jgi:predicted ATPase/DNA-binding SARP family transcriptional activator
MKFRVLGPIEAWVGDRKVELGAPKQRALLAVLLLNSERIVSQERLLQLLWQGSPPETAAHALEVYVSNLRKALAPQQPAEVIRRQAPGYLLRVDSEAIDLRRFEHLAAKGRQMLDQGDAQGSSLLLREAMSLWRGPAFAGADSSEFLLGERGRLEALRLDALENRIEAELRLGHHLELIGELERLVAENPFRERLCGQLMLALYRAGRQAEASSTYQATRLRLADELGMDPSPGLQDLLTKILRQDRSLEVQPRTRTQQEPARFTNLPAPLTSFIGRKKAVVQIVQFLKRSRVVTLVGPAGIGKTRLAIEVGRELHDAYPDGVWLIELAGLSDGKLIPDAIRVTLGFNEMRSKSGLEAVAVYLQQHSMLIILDNCEHVIEAAAQVVEELAARCPKVVFLTTSRERLRIPGEQLWEVDPLSVPAATTLGGVVSIVESEAVQLFLDRAALSRASFGLTDANSQSVAEISRRLEGIPLALELAAAQVATMSTDEITRRLDDPFELLTSGYRTASHRHQTLMAAVQWSYGLLMDEERLVFDRLSVFRGFDIQAAAGVCSSESISRDACTAATLSLADKSLIAVEGERHRLLETLRKYAADRLRVRGETSLMEAAHGRYFLGLASGRAPGGLATWLRRMETETDNLRSALDWALDNDPDLAARGILSLDFWWRMRSHIGEVRAYLDRLLLRRQAEDATRVRLLAYRGWYGWDAMGEAAVAPQAMESALELARALGDPLAWVDALLVWARYATNRSELARSESLLAQALELLGESGDPERVAEILHQRGLLRGAQFDLTRARADLEESLTIRRSLNRSDEAALTMAFVGGIVGATGDLDKGRHLVAEALLVSRELGDMSYNHQALDVAAGLAIQAGQADRGLTLMAAADAALASVDWKPVAAWDRVMAPYLELGRETLGPLQAAAAEEMGGRMSYFEAVEYALEWLSTDR